jgi:hypothetical protein
MPLSTSPPCINTIVLDTTSKRPHSCAICEPFFLLDLHGGNRCPDKGCWELITDHQSSTGNEYGYWFYLWYGQAEELAKQGCDLMMWLVTLRRPDTTPDSQLRAYFMHNSEEQLALDFVYNVSDYTDSKDFARKLVLCVESEYAPCKLWPMSTLT